MPDQAQPTVRFMLVLRNLNCGHVLMASISRSQLQDRQAHLVTVRGRTDFRIQTVTADQAAQALIDLKAGVCCAGCQIDRPDSGPPPIYYTQ